MKTILISDAAHSAIIREASPSFRETGRQLPGGSWLIPIQDSTYSRLLSHRFSGETINDLIIRICSTVNHRPN